jgi:hypothetical protein
MTIFVHPDLAATAELCPTCDFPRLRPDRLETDPKPVSVLAQLLIVKHALYDGEIRLAQDTVEELIVRLKAI